MIDTGWPDLLEQALRTAALAHRNQHRKGSTLPYLTHPVAVGWILQRFGFVAPELLAAALLHDVVEDTDCSLLELESVFPRAVTEIVAILSEQKLDEAGQKRSWEDRKRTHLEHVENGSLPARAVVLADKYHNLKTTLYDLEQGEPVWNRFNAPPERVLWYHREMVRAAAGTDAELIPLANACRELIDRLAKSIE